ncbi:uncharacterized protein BXZ73DRAFT_77153 [Epithele typhae]|uniref:uncharacterized protein n=1 Tax=Epithele typhae TaxID=378194 RepID=UPI0020077BC7|nr:uncharacterized protein BXZ73DRAFT_77153 [Epithele typhae]KAH9934062.1 hypothetical protein BXZ73DRAFT_77153 [Epithele typhae]
MSSTEHTPVIVLGFSASFFKYNLFSHSKTRGDRKWQGPPLADSTPDLFWEFEAVSFNTALLLKEPKSTATLRMKEAEILRYSDDLYDSKTRAINEYTGEHRMIRTLIDGPDGFAVAQITFHDISQEDKGVENEVTALCKIAWGKEKTGRAVNEANVYDKCEEFQGDFIPKKLGFFARQGDGIDCPPLCCLMLSPDGEPEDSFMEMWDDRREEEYGYMKNLVYRRVGSENISTVLLTVLSTAVRQDILGGLVKLHDAGIVFSKNGLQPEGTLIRAETGRYMIYDLDKCVDHAECDQMEGVPRKIEMFQPTPNNICSKFDSNIESLVDALSSYTWYLHMRVTWLDAFCLAVPSKFQVPPGEHDIEHYIPLEILLEPDYEKAAKMITALIKQKDDKIIVTQDFHDYVQQKAENNLRSVIQQWLTRRTETAEKGETVAVPLKSLNQDKLPESWLEGVAKMGVRVLDHDGLLLE